MIRKLRHVKSREITLTTKGMVNVKALRVRHVGGVRKKMINIAGARRGLVQGEV